MRRLATLTATSLLAAALATTVACTGTPVRGDGQNERALPGEPTYDTTGAVALDRFARPPRAGDWLAVRDAPVAGFGDGPVLGWIHVVAVDEAEARVEVWGGAAARRAIADGAAAANAKALAAPSGARLTPASDVVELAATPDKRVAGIRRVDGDSATLDRGSLDLVISGDVYTLGDPVRPGGPGWAIYRVVGVDDGSASLERLAGDRFASTGDRVVWAGSVARTGRTLTIEARVDPVLDGEAIVRRALGPTSLASHTANVETRPDAATLPCRHGRALAAALRAEGRTLPGDDSAFLVLDLVRTSGGVSVGWTPWPTDVSTPGPTDALDGCVEVSAEQASVLARFAVLAGEARWTELAAHAGAWARDGGLGAGTRVAAVWAALAALELDDPGHAIASLQAVRDTSDSAGLRLLHAQLLIDLAETDTALPLLDASGERAGLAAWMRVGATAPGIEPSALQAALPGQLEDPFATGVDAWRALFAIADDPTADPVALALDLVDTPGSALALHPGLLAGPVQALSIRWLAHPGGAGSAERLAEIAAVGWRATGQWFRAAGAELERAAILANAGAPPVDLSESALLAADDLVRAGALQDAAGVRLGAASIIADAVQADPSLGPELLETLVEALRSARVLYSHANSGVGVARTWLELGEILLGLYGDAPGALEAFEAAALYAARAGNAGLAARAELGAVLALDASGGAPELVAERLGAARTWAEAAQSPELIDAIERIEAMREP